MAKVQATLHPEGEQRANTVVAQGQMTEMQARIYLGFFQPYDYIVAVLVLLTWITLLFWKIFGDPSTKAVVGCALVSGTLLQAWTVSLVYRCMDFVIKLQAYVNTLPEASARIVMSAYSGGYKGAK